MREAFAAGCCQAGCSGDAGGGGSTRARGKHDCRTHRAGQGGALIFLDGAERGFSFCFHSVSYLHSLCIPEVQQKCFFLLIKHLQSPYPKYLKFCIVYIHVYYLASSFPALAGSLQHFFTYSSVEKCVTISRNVYHVTRVHGFVHVYSRARYKQKRELR